MIDILGTKTIAKQRCWPHCIQKIQLLDYYAGKFSDEELTIADDLRQSARNFEVVASLLLYVSISIGLWTSKSNSWLTPGHTSFVSKQPYSFSHRQFTQDEY